MCGILPFLIDKKVNNSSSSTFNDWPQTFEGQKLHQISLKEEEIKFNKDFPGSMARFTDGKREFFLRHINKESRKLHPAQDCFRAYGYAINPLPVKLDNANRTWSCVRASKGEQDYRVCELIVDTHGNSWSEPSTWYWNALLSGTMQFNQTSGPWLAYVVAEEIES
jgi:hypothetical protein